jgi:hypothetical protein
MWALRPLGGKVSHSVCGKKWHKALCPRVHPHQAGGFDVHLSAFLLALKIFAPNRNHTLPRKMENYNMYGQNVISNVTFIAGLIIM